MKLLKLFKAVFHSKRVNCLLIISMFLLSGYMNLFGQSRPDPSADPISGTVRLSAGFSPDPHSVRVTSGGSIDISQAGLCTNCRGFASRAPDVKFHWTGSTSSLRIYFEADDSSKDATLIINTPNGTWIGNDDACTGTKNPKLLLNQYGAGRYDIWIGSYTSGEYISGNLRISERDLGPCSGTTGDNTGRLDFSADPISGTVTLSSGFSPDPHTINVTSGGSINASGMCTGCTGFASRAPDVKLQWTGSTSNLRIFFKPNDSSKDATLIINTPNGTWLGNDDTRSGCKNPMISLNEHGAGRFDIWVGSYTSGEYISGVLTITELSSDPCGGTIPEKGGPERPDPSATPISGSTTLNSGFSPDPHTVNVTSGGTIDVSQLGLGTGCTGFVSRAPDYKLNWTGSTSSLRVYFKANESDKDATLIINTPTGTWIGNDDAHSGCNNPMLLLNEHGAGRYDIWVGSYRSGEYISGVLTVTELSTEPCNTTPDKRESLDPSANPISGSVTLASGFTPDPHTINVTSGGSINVSGLNLGTGCTGFASKAPDVKLNWTGSTSNLRVHFKANDESKDATLIINTPNGTWIGNDDTRSECKNPMLRLNEYGAGRYDIWVGSYSSGDYISGVLTISEISSEPCSTSGSCLDPSADPNFGTQTISSGFSPDPKTVRITSGGSIDVSSCGYSDGCKGFASRAPDLKIQWTGSTSDLRVFFEADDREKDATLIINTPNGTWIGNDDARSGCNNPMLLLQQYGAGRYDVWVGSYKSGENIPGTFTITELDRQPR
ncbi:MAG: hypothetical protein PHT69_07005 [Bacteroidales bacterium]|nr:hypothetical protein [Bacteroidales bacterium]